jgi:two-component system chemotaxis response regulator CheV
VVRLEERVVFILDMENVVAELDPNLAIRFNKIPDELADKNKIYTVLHADDSSHVRGLVKSLLEGSKQFNVIQTTTGEEAWSVLLKMKDDAEKNGTSVKDAVDAVISDIEMPRMDGLALCRHIKEDHDLKYLPVALFSSLITREQEHKGRSVGADAQFAKPDLQGLSTHVLTMIRNKIQPIEPEHLDKKPT